MLATLIATGLAARNEGLGLGLGSPASQFPTLRRGRQPASSSLPSTRHHQATWCTSRKRGRAVRVFSVGDGDGASLEDRDPSLAALYAELGLAPDQRLDGDEDEDEDESDEEVEAASGGAREGDDKYDRLQKGLRLKATSSGSSMNTPTNNKSKRSYLKSAEAAQRMDAALKDKTNKDPDQ